MEKKSHILIFRLSAMGDVAMTVPIVRAFVTQYPNVRVTIVSRPFFKPFFDGISRVDFFAVDLKNKHKGAIGLLRLFSDLKKLNIDYFADFHDVLRSKIIRTLFVASGTQVASLDKGRSEKKALTRVNNKIFKPVPSMFDNHLNTLNKLGFLVDLAKPLFPEIKPLSQDLITIVGVKQEKWIGIAPFAQYETKVYPLDLMKQVIALLTENKDYKIFLFGGGNKEIGILNQLKNNKSQVIVIAGKINLEQELNLIQHLDLMVSMDSGNAHIAAMLGKKVISIWGGTHPYAGFMPFNQPYENSLIPDLGKYPLIPLSVYGNKVIPGYEDVMRTISPQSVVSKINEVLEKV